MLQKSVKLLQFKHGVSNNDRLLNDFNQDDICFYHFMGGNTSETKELVENLYILKEKKVLVFGIFRFPFKFEGKKRLQTSISQYFLMKDICDTVTYFHSDGMMDVLPPGTSIRDAQQKFQAFQESVEQGLKEMLGMTGEMNIDFRDIQTFIKESKGPMFLQTFEGESFDEPLKYLISAPYLPQDFADGQQMIINIGYTRNVDMDAFRQINLRLNDLFHKADLFKMGSYFIDELDSRFRITLLINGLGDPYPRPINMKRTYTKPLWFKRKWSMLLNKSKEAKWLSAAIKQDSQQNGINKKDELQF